MALSEQERKLLEQLEASLKAEDPKLADALSGSSTVRVQRRRAALAGIGFFAGLIALLSGISAHPLISILGFVAMFVSALFGLAAWQRVEVQQAKPTAAPKKESRSTPNSSAEEFLRKLDEQWRRRNQQDDL